MWRHLARCELISRLTSTKEVMMQSSVCAIFLSGECIFHDSIVFEI